MTIIARGRYGHTKAGNRRGHETMALREGSLADIWPLHVASCGVSTAKRLALMPIA